MFKFDVLKTKFKKMISLNGWAIASLIFMALSAVCTFKSSQHTIKKDGDVTRDKIDESSSKITNPIQDLYLYMLSSQISLTNEIKHNILLYALLVDEFNKYKKGLESSFDSLEKNLVPGMENHMRNVNEDLSKLTNKFEVSKILLKDLVNKTENEPIISKHSKYIKDYNLMITKKREFNSGDISKDGFNNYLIKFEESNEQFIDEVFEMKNQLYIEQKNKMT